MKSPTRNENKGSRNRNSWRFWFVFWAVAALLLFSWYVFLQVKNNNIGNLKPLANVLPVSSERKNELQVLADAYQKMGGFDREKTFLILFQNSFELRPGGGFIGSFGIIKTRSGKVSGVEVHDTGIFDGRIPNTETPPAPLAEIMGAKTWKMRDSNWSPDFKTNAQKAEYFYGLGKGSEDFDGIIAVNSAVLNSFLAIAGPVKIDGYPGEYNDQTAILQLEYQVEKGFQEQGISKDGRKGIMKDLAEVLVGKAHDFTISQQLAMAKKIEEHLKRKDIQIFFKDEALQKEISEIGWDGKVNGANGDYLMIVDANLNSFKSDYCIRRKVNYSVDLSSETPEAILNITYEHTCRAKDWMTTDYRDWLRVYAPENSYLEESSGQEDSVRFSQEFGKKVFAMFVFVPVGETKTITLKYQLPGSFKDKPYELLFQKQSGSGELPFEITVKGSDGKEVGTEKRLTEDQIFSF